MSYYGAERERTFKAYNLADYDSSRATGLYNIPTLEAEYHIPSKLIAFNKMLSEKDKSNGVHFFIDDYQFERVWNRPQFYIEKLKQFDCCFTPDFSLYTDMPMAMQIYNVYRSRLIGQMMQDEGIKVIPTVGWSDEKSYSFCFDGLPEKGVVAVSTVGIMRNKAAKELFYKGMEAMIERLNPLKIIMYGKPLEGFGDNVITFESEVSARMNASRRAG